MREATLSELENLQYSAEYGKYLLADPSIKFAISAGATLDEIQADCYLFEEFIASLGLTFP